MSRVYAAAPVTTLLDMLMAGHGASVVVSGKDLPKPQALSCRERAEMYHQKYPSIHQCPTIVELNSARKP